MIDLLTHRTLYKRDSSGRIRVWFVEQDGRAYRYVAGLQDGKLTRSEWTVAVPKSRPTAIEQANFEVAAAYEHQLKRDYFETVGEVDTPRFLAPMLAKTYKAFPGPGYAQPKLDGIRNIARITGNWSREGQPILSVPHIHEALAPLFAEFPDLILDGELYNHELKEDFEEISSLCRKTKDISADDLAQSASLIQYHVYDLPSHPGKFSARSRELRELVEALNSPLIVFVETVPVATAEQFDALTDRWLEEKYEGSMHRLDEEYEADKRSKFLQKRKVFEDGEFPVSRIEEGTGNWAGLAKRVFVLLENKEECGCGIKGNKAFARKLLAERDQQKVVTIRFKGRTGYGKLRHGVATKWHGEARSQ